ncbi:Fanconi anemia group G protein, partial [Tachysurus ichikawai]
MVKQNPFTTSSQVKDTLQEIPVDDGLSLPRLPVVYLEVAFALLKAKQAWDALVVCEEVIAKTVDLIPERLSITPSVAVSRELLPLMLEVDAPEEKLQCVLWSGAAYFLQGQAHFHLKDTKLALTNFTRAINQLVKVCIIPKGADGGDVDHTVMILEALKGKVLAFRAVCFVEREQLKEALRDFQLSLQATPGCRNTEMWLVEVLWRLDRKQEAAAMWRHALNSTQSSTPVVLPLYLQTWHEDPTCFDLSSLQKKMEEFVQNSFVKT